MSRGGGEVHKALGIQSDKNLAIEGFFVNDGDSGDVCVEAKAADDGNTTSEAEAPGVKKPHKRHGTVR